MYKRLDSVLAWVWVCCLLLTFADWFSPLEMTSQLLSAGVHCGIWLLVYPMSRHFNIIDWGLARFMWRALLIGTPIAWLLAFIGLIAWPLMGLLMPPAITEYLFFSGTGPGWKPDYVYFQRGSSLMMGQRSGNTSWRNVQVTPVTSLFQWVVPLPDDEPRKATAHTTGYTGWTAVQKEWDTFVRTPAEQRQFEENQRNYPLVEAHYKAAERREDSLAYLGRLPAAAQGLPAATQRGANTLGCLFGEARESWRDYAYCFVSNPVMEVYCGVGSKCTPNFSSPGCNLEIGVNRTIGNNSKIANINHHITLYIGNLTGPGVYRLGENNGNSSSYLFFEGIGGAGEFTGNQYTTTANRLSFVRVTRFDTVAHVVSGTFEGYLDSPGHEHWLLLLHGRFDINYKVPYATRPRNA